MSEELDMSRPGSELFPETTPTQYNSYADVNTGSDVGDPLNTGVQGNAVDAGQADKDYNFRAVREEITKLKEESSYWKGQAEAYSRQPVRNEPVLPSQDDAMAALDWDDGKDVRKAFEALQRQNESIRHELKDAITQVSTKAQHSDWNNMVTQHVPQLTAKNPIFAEMIKNASNPYEAAYLLAELNAKATQGPPQQPQMSDNAQRAIYNSQKPMSPASVGGRGQLSSADYYASMSDKDFMELAAKNMANI